MGLKIGQVEIEPYTKIFYNNTPYSERMIEVPLMLWFLERYYQQDTIEVGAVSPYYRTKIKHQIYDPGDPSEHCIQVRAEDIDYTNKVVLSISTIEHIGTGDYDGIKKSGAAVAVLKEMMKAKRYLITWASGYNAELDEYTKSLQENVIKIKREGERDWSIQNTLDGVLYNSPYPYGNGIYVVTNCPCLLQESPRINKVAENLELFCPPGFSPWLSQVLKGHSLLIHMALYGSDMHKIDVASVLHEYVEDGSYICLPVNNVSLRIDPCPDKQKTLYVLYSINDERQSTEIPEGETLTLGSIL